MKADDTAKERAIAALNLAEGLVDEFDREDGIDADKEDYDYGPPNARRDLETARRALLERGLTAETGLLAVAALLATVPYTLYEDHTTLVDDGREIVAAVLGEAA